MLLLPQIAFKFFQTTPDLFFSMIFTKVFFFFGEKRHFEDVFKYTSPSYITRTNGNKAGTKFMWVSHKSLQGESSNYFVLHSTAG